MIIREYLVIVSWGQDGFTYIHSSHDDKASARRAYNEKRNELAKEMPLVESKSSVHIAHVQTSVTIGGRDES